MNIDDTAISGNGIGVQANGTIRLSNSDIVNNSTGVTGTGSPVTYGNNRVSGNGAPGNALVPAAPGQQ
jgi:hypothetical protein